MFPNETNNAEHDHRGFKSRHSPHLKLLQCNNFQGISRTYVNMIDMEGALSWPGSGA